uniref:Methyltransferase type 12 n=1 Tax=uncultured bacterium 59 TaxID=698390 RepID=E3T6F7_9BACT|nr:methyltransferase type 12 [uncultured bacterium 59]
MSGWTEEDSGAFLDIAAVAVPRRIEMMATMISLVPFLPSETPRIVELGVGDGRLASAMLDCFPEATLVALDGSESMRNAACARLARFGERARVAPFELEALEWWELIFGADVVVSSLTLHHLNDAKKQYVYKAIADRISDRGALIIGDLVEPSHAAGRALAADAWDASVREQSAALGAPQLFQRFLDAKWNHFRFPDASDQPSPLFHHLVWLKHAGFGAVDCWWMCDGHAVFGGHKKADSMSGGVSFADSLSAVRIALSGRP